MALITSSLSRINQAIDSLSPRDHICMFYSSPSEQLATLIPYMIAGLSKGERCLYAGDVSSISSVKKALKKSGVDVDAELDKGSLLLLTNEETYRKDGVFEPKKMIGYLVEAINDTKDHGYKRLRTCGEMSWALDEAIDNARILEYESTLYHAFQKYGFIGMCQFHVPRFSPGVLVDVLRTHPKAMFGDLVCKNFYFEPPEDFIPQEHSSKEFERMVRNLQEFERSEVELLEGRTHLKQMNEKLEDLVKKRTTELQSSLQEVQAQKKELERMNHFMVGREMKMMELKAEIRRLKSQLPS